jgi:hypothetical protein
MSSTTATPAASTDVKTLVGRFTDVAGMLGGLGVIPAPAGS